MNADENFHQEFHNEMKRIDWLSTGDDWLMERCLSIAYWAREYTKKEYEQKLEMAVEALEKIDKLPFASYRDDIAKEALEKIKALDSKE